MNQVGLTSQISLLNLVGKKCTWINKSDLPINFGGKNESAWTSRSDLPVNFSRKANWFGLASQIGGSVKQFGLTSQIHTPFIVKSISLLNKHQKNALVSISKCQSSPPVILAGKQSNPILGMERKSKKIKDRKECVASYQM